MKRILYLTILCLLLNGGISAQVTIGSGQKPVAGALLDLKTETDGTSKQGMVLPRVKLADIDALTMGTNVIANANNAWTNHAGLVVYNISGITPAKCAPIPDGLYVWDGAKWNGINTPTPIPPATLDVGSKLNFDFPSGLDLRPLPTVAETFTATWTPGTLPYINTPHASFGGVSFSGANALPVSPLAASPVAFNLLPDAMADGDIATNPFRTKESTLSFDVAANECYPAQSKTITLNQTNKAMTVSTPYKEYTANATNETNTLTTNADWKLVSNMPNNATNAIANIKIDGTTVSAFPTVTQTDYEQNNNAGKAATLTYDIIVGSAKSRYSTLTFADASATKRFSDVTITVLQCPNAGVLQHSIEQWALTAGFTQIQIDAVKSTGTDSPILPIGIQLHRDQSNNLFLSSSFHSTNITGTTNTERWMIHNLSATSFAPNAGRTGDDATVLQPFGASPSATNNYLTPLWGYPNGGANAATVTSFTNNPRLGRLYNWAAATNSRGGTTDGQNAITDGENVTIARPTIQGICPDGWHLPSDVEWTTLEQELATNTSRYSSTPNVGGTIAIGVAAWRGTLHGKAMKEICEPYTLTHQGTSNGITSDRPGFDLLLAGNAYSGSARNFGTNGYLWSASGPGTIGAWSRSVSSGNSQVHRGAGSRNNLFSVRCKK